MIIEVQQKTLEKLDGPLMSQMEFPEMKTKVDRQEYKWQRWVNHNLNCRKDFRIVIAYML